MIRKKQVLVLNADCTILSISTLDRIIGMYINQKINILKTSGSKKMHSSFNFEGIPSIVCLKNYIYIPYKEVNLTRNRIFKRDKYQCQYCGKKLTNTIATIDHIIPKCKPDSPGNTWDNIVACCIECNSTKGNKTLQQSGMSLMRKPFVPKLEHFFQIKNEWKDYINLSSLNI